MQKHAQQNRNISQAPDLIGNFSRFSHGNPRRLLIRVDYSVLQS